MYNFYPFERQNKVNQKEPYYYIIMAQNLTMVWVLYGPQLEYGIYGPICDMDHTVRTIVSLVGSAAETIEAGREHVSPVVPRMAFSCHPWFMIYGRDPRAISTPLPQSSAHSPPPFSSSAPPCPALSAAYPSLRAKPPFALVQFPKALSTTTSESI